MCHENHDDNSWKFAAFQVPAKWKKGCSEPNTSQRSPRAQETPIPMIPEESDIQWRVLNSTERLSSTAIATFYAPHVGCPEPERVAFWHRLFASIQAVTHALPDVPVVLAGDSDNRPTRPQDRACIELIRVILDTFGLQICNPLNAPTHRRGAAT